LEHKILLEQSSARARGKVLEENGFGVVLEKKGGALMSSASMGY